MKVEIVCGGKTYAGEVAESAVEDLVKQGLRYYMLNVKGGKDKAAVFNEYRLGGGKKNISEVVKKKDEEIEALRAKLREAGIEG